MYKCNYNNFLGKTAEEILEHRKSDTTLRVQWSLTCSEGISFKFDGIPFLCVGTINYQCHQGSDIDLHTKRRRKEERDKKQVRKNKTINTASFNFI